MMHRYGYDTWYVYWNVIRQILKNEVGYVDITQNKKNIQVNYYHCCCKNMLNKIKINYNKKIV